VVSKNSGLFSFPRIKIVVFTWARCYLLFFESHSVRDSSRALQELTLVVREIFGPICHGVVYGARYELVQLCFEVCKGPLFVLILLSEMWFQQMSTLTLRDVVIFNTEFLGLD
jgi:hypothetical protein